MVAETGPDQGPKVIPVRDQGPSWTATPVGEIRSSHPEVACVMLTSYAADEALLGLPALAMMTIGPVRESRPPLPWAHACQRSS
jgi:hypothetical protein